MGFFDDVLGGDEEDSSNNNNGGGGLGDIVDDVVDDVSDTVDEAVDAGQEAARDISEGAGDVADEVSEGDLGGAVDEASDTVEDVASGSSDTGSSGSSGGPPDPSPEPTSDPEPSSDPAPDPDTGGGSSSSSSSGSNPQDVADQLLNQGGQGDLPETQEEVDQAQNFRENNPIVAATNPQMDKFLDTREQNLEARNQLDQQIDNLQEAPENTQVRFGQGDNADTISREAALDRLRDQRQDVTQAIQENNQTVISSRNTRNPSQTSSQDQGSDLVDQGVDTVESFFGTGAEIVQGGSDIVEGAVNTASDVTGIETPDAPDTPEIGIPWTDLEVDVDNIWMGDQDNTGGSPVLESTADGQADVVREFDQFSEDLRDTGLTLMSEGQDLGEGFAETVPQSGDAIAWAGEQTGVQEVEDFGRAWSNVQDSFQEGVGTAGTQAAGFFTAGAGSFGMLGVDASRDPVATGQNFIRGEQEFLQQTAGQFSEGPVQFIAEEGGEEVSEAAIGGLLFGGAGAAAGIVPTPEPEVEPEFNPEVEPEAETETEVEEEIETEFESDATMEDLPSGFTQVQDVETNVQPIREDLVREPAPGVREIRPGEGREVFPDQPRAEEFDFEVGEETASARATPTEPDRVQDPGEFRGENPETGFTDVEQEIVREVRGRDDVTIRQGETVEERGPGLTQPEEGQTVIEAEETETGGELLFSVMGPVPPSLVEPETETEINPQPENIGPDPELADVSPDVDVGNIGPEVEFEPETETEIRVEPEAETEVEPEIDRAIDPVIDQRDETGQEFGQDQGQDFREEQVQEITNDMPPEPNGPDKIMEPGGGFEPEVFPDFRPEPEFEPEPDRTPDRDFGSEDNPFARETGSEGQGGEADPEFRPSLEAILFDVEGKAPADDEVLTGTEIRPVPEELEEEFDFPF